MPTCPFCASEMVYPLLNTLRCKRCKGIWKEGDEGPDRSAHHGPSDQGKSLIIRKRTESLEKRMEKRLDHCLTKSQGKFCISTITWQAGDFSFDLFRRYLKLCVRKSTLTETKDRYGRVWYSRQG